jgi:hypothetical protein
LNFERIALWQSGLEDSGMGYLAIEH